MIKRIIDFSKYSSIKIGGENEVSILEFTDLDCRLDKEGLHFCRAPNKTQQPTALDSKNLHIKNCNTNNCNTNDNEGLLYLNNEAFKIIGRASNCLISPEAKNLLLLGAEFDYILDLGEIIEIGAATNSSKVFRYFRDRNLGGLEFLAHLPGLMGGLTNMNAGLKEYEMKNIIHSVNVNGTWIQGIDMGFKYRHTDRAGVIFAIRVKRRDGFNNGLVELFQKMRSNQPRVASCGSCFKNPENDFAGRLLEKCGLKGYEIERIGFSQMHANFLVNGAKKSNQGFSNCLKVIRYAQEEVLRLEGVALECEVKIIN